MPSETNPTINDQILDTIVTRFLQWPLPTSVFCDPCTQKFGDPNRSGTNLLTAYEAREMFKDVLTDVVIEPTEWPSELKQECGDVTFAMLVDAKDWDAANVIGARETSALLRRAADLIARIVAHRPANRPVVTKHKDSYERTRQLVQDLSIDRYGQPLIAALNLCLEIESEKANVDHNLLVTKAALLREASAAKAEREALRARLVEAVNSHQKKTECDPCTQFTYDVLKEIADVFDRAAT